MTTITALCEHACFGGAQDFHEHDSDIIGLPMRFAAYRLPAAQFGEVPVLFYLAGLTCTEEAIAALRKNDPRKVFAEASFASDRPGLETRRLLQLAAQTTAGDININQGHTA